MADGSSDLNSVKPLNGKSAVSVCMPAALLECSGTGGTGASCVAAIATCEGETLGLR